MSISSIQSRVAGPYSRRSLARFADTPLLAQLAGAITSHGARIARFGIVGGAGVVVNTVVLYLLVRAGGMGHMAAAGIASEVSILGNFALNDRWTFADRRPSSSWLGRCARYNAVALAGMTVSLGVLYVLTTFLGMHYLVANLLAISTAIVSNYALNTRFTWTSRVSKSLELVPVPVMAE